MAMACALSCSAVSSLAVSETPTISASSSHQGLRLSGSRIRVAAPLKSAAPRRNAIRADVATAVPVKEKVAASFDKLQTGFEAFKKEVYEKNPELTDKLKTGQWPTIMIIACADSRVCPTTIFNLSPGDAFVIRNVANVVPAFESEGNPSMGSAVEYAVLHLKVDHILVVGHRACGGIGALVKMVPEDGKYSTTFIERWMQVGKPARAAVNAALKGEDVEIVCKSCERESVNNSLNNLMSYPFVDQAVSDGKVSLHGGYYDHVAGTFDKWDFPLAPKA